MIPFQTPIYSGDTFEGLLELDPLIHVRYKEHGYDWGGIISLSQLVGKAGKVNALKCAEVQRLMENLEGMKIKALDKVLEKVAEAAE